MCFQSTKALILILGFFSYKSAESACPTSGFYTRTYSVEDSSCNDLGITFRSYPVITWNDDTSSTINNTVTFSYVSGRLFGRGSGYVLSGRFIGKSTNTLFAHATQSGADDCAAGGISELPGVAQITIFGDGVFACIGPANVEFDPPLTNTPATVERTNTVDYAHCIGSLLC